jgi:predicted Zn-dependent protease
MSGPLWDELAELALSRVRAAGVEYADIRLLDTTTRTISGEDRRIAHIRESTDRGFGIRVLHRGAWGVCGQLRHFPRRNSTCGGPRRRNCQRIGLARHHEGTSGA